MRIKVLSAFCLAASTVAGCTKSEDYKPPATGFDAPAATSEDATNTETQSHPVDINSLPTYLREQVEEFAALPEGNMARKLEILEELQKQNCPGCIAALVTEELKQEYYDYLQEEYDSFAQQAKELSYERIVGEYHLGNPENVLPGISDVLSDGEERKSIEEMAHDSYARKVASLIVDGDLKYYELMGKHDLLGIPFEEAFNNIDRYNPDTTMDEVIGWGAYYKSHNQGDYDHGDWPVDTQAFNACLEQAGKAQSQPYKNTDNLQWNKSAYDIDRTCHRMTMLPKPF